MISIEGKIAAVKSAYPTIMVRSDTIAQSSWTARNSYGDGSVIGRGISENDAFDDVFADLTPAERALAMDCSVHRVDVGFYCEQTEGKYGGIDIPYVCPARIAAVEREGKSATQKQAERIIAKKSEQDDLGIEDLLVKDESLRFSKDNSDYSLSLHFTCAEGNQPPPNRSRTQRIRARQESRDVMNNEFPFDVTAPGLIQRQGSSSEQELPIDDSLKPAPDRTKTCCGVAGIGLESGRF